MAKAPSKPSAPALSLGGVTINDAKGDNSPNRAAILMWGPAGVGKTTFAATAPGTKLWLTIGDNEHASVANRKDVKVADFSGLTHEELFKQAKSENPFGLDQFLAANEDISTVVLDSVTAMVAKALENSIDQRIGAGRGFTPTLEAPGIAAYGARNAITLQVLRGLLRVTAKHGVNIILLTHRDDPTMDEDGKTILYISMMLGGKIVNNVTWMLSEIWYYGQKDTATKERYLLIKPRYRLQPMKSRMFDMETTGEFIVKYDARKPDNAPGQMTIAGWHEQWLDGGKEKLELPK